MIPDIAEPNLVALLASLAVSDSYSFRGRCVGYSPMAHRVQFGTVCIYIDALCSVLTSVLGRGWECRFRILPETDPSGPLLHVITSGERTRGGETDGVLVSWEVGALSEVVSCDTLILIAVCIDTFLRIPYEDDGGGESARGPVDDLKIYAFLGKTSYRLDVIRGNSRLPSCFEAWYKVYPLGVNKSPDVEFTATCACVDIGDLHTRFPCMLSSLVGSPLEAPPRSSGILAADSNSTSSPNPTKADLLYSVCTGTPSNISVSVADQKLYVRCRETTDETLPGLAMVACGYFFPCTDVPGTVEIIKRGLGRVIPEKREEKTQQPGRRDESDDAVATAIELGFLCGGLFTLSDCKKDG